MNQAKRNKSSVRYFFKSVAYWLLLALTFSPLTFSSLAAAAQNYPLVLRSGRVIDPATGLDGIRDVAIKEGRYVREAKLLDLSSALAKMTLLPARRLESFTPAFKRKGRLQVGADADIAVFDPSGVIDKATYANPYQASVGISHVLVNGSAGWAIAARGFSRQAHAGAAYYSHWSKIANNSEKLNGLSKQANAPSRRQVAFMESISSL